MWGGKSRRTGVVVFERCLVVVAVRCLVVGCSGSNMGKESERAVVRVKRGMAEGISDARVECMREENEG